MAYIKDKRVVPEFWIHPFGPLTKNIPLLVMVYYLYTKE
ncbi:DoxX-like family protein [uncultured Psychrosphaera sp.]